MTATWHAPYTWLDGDVPDGHGDHTDAAALHADNADGVLSLNWQIRDNVELLAVPRDTATGKF